MQGDTLSRFCLSFSGALISQPGSSQVCVSFILFASIVEFSELVSRENLLHDAEAEGDISFPELLRGISAWVYLQNRTQGLYRQLMWKDPVMVPLVRESQSEHALFSKLKRFVKFGSAAYGDFGHSFLSRKIPHISTDTWLAPRNHHSFASHTNNSVSSIYHSSDSLFKDSNVYSPKFYVVVDEESNNIVLTFRGTLGFHDLLVGIFANQFLMCRSHM